MANTSVSQTFGVVDSGGYDSIGSYFPQSTAATYDYGLAYESVFFAYNPAPIKEFINSLLSTSVSIVLSFKLSNGYYILHGEDGGDTIDLDSFVFTDNDSQTRVLSNKPNISSFDDLYKNYDLLTRLNLIGTLSSSYTIPSSFFTDGNGLDRGFIFESGNSNVTRVSDFTLTVSGYKFNDLPIVVGLSPNLTTLDSATIAPFSQVILNNPGNPTGLGDDIIITVENSSATPTDNLGTLSLPVGVNGTLVPGEVGSLTPIDGPGRYTLYGYGVANLQTALQSLVFTPANLGTGSTPQRATFELKYESVQGYQGVTTVTEGLVISHDQLFPTIFYDGGYLQPVLDDAQIKPFTSLVINDPNMGTNDVVTIRLTGADGQPTGAFGSLQTTTGTATLTGDGSGTYTLSGGGSFAALAYALQNLIFIAAPRVTGSVPIDIPITLPLVVTLKTDHGLARNDNTTVVISVDTKPNITGAAASQPLLDDGRIQPFAALSVRDPANGSSDVFSIRLVGDNGEQTDAFGTLHTTTGSAVLTDDGFGSYTLSGGGGFANLVDALKHLSFVPAARAIGSVPITVSLKLGLKTETDSTENDGTSVTISHDHAQDLIYASAAGSSPINFSRAGLQLIVDDTPSVSSTLPNTLSGLAPGDSIYLTKFAYYQGATATASGNTLIFNDAIVSKTFTLAEPLDGLVTVSSDGAGGTLLTIVKAPPSVSAVSFDAQAATLTVTGAHLTTLASDYQLADFTLTGQGGQSYTLTGASSVLGTPASGSLTIQLGAADAIQIAALLDLNGTISQSGTSYSLSATAGWDTEAGAVGSVPVSVTNSFDPATHRAAAASLQQLNELIAAADGMTSGSYEIDIANRIDLAGDLGAINLQTGVSLTIANQAGASGIGDGATAGSLVVTGRGNVLLTGINIFSGGVKLNGGVLQIANRAIAGSGPITFGTSASATLAFVFDPKASTIQPGSANPLLTEVFSNTIRGFLPGDTIDLQDAGLDTSVVANGNNSFTFSGSGNKAVTLAFDRQSDFSPFRFILQGDGLGGTNVTLGKAGASVISGTVQTQIKDNAAGFQPFRNVSVTDPNIVPTENVTVSWNASLGSLSDGINNFRAGTLSYVGSAAATTAYLESLVFTPAKVAAGQRPNVVNFSLTDTNAGDQKSHDVSTTVTVTAFNTAPGIVGLANATLNDHQTTAPLAVTSITDPDVGQTETVTLVLNPVGNAAQGSPIGQAGDSNGSLSLAGQAGYTLLETSTGSGIYSLTGTSGAGMAGLNKALQAIVFTPTEYQVTPGKAVATALSVQIGDGFTTTSAATTLTVTALNDAPAISGVASSVTLNDHQTATPFGAVGLTDPDLGQAEAVTLTLKNANGQVTDANGALSLAGSPGALAKSGIGTYSLTGLSGVGINALNSLLAAVAFTPTKYQVAPDQTVTTTLAAMITDSMATATATTALSVKALNDPASIGGTATGTVTENITLAASGQLTILDPNFGQSVFALPSAASLAGTYGNFTFNSAAGAWTYALNNLAPKVQALAQGQTVTDKFTVASIDGTASQAITVTITGTNESPVFAMTAATANIGEMGTATGSGAKDSASGAIAFADADLTDTHSLRTVPPTFIWSGGTLSASQTTALSTASTFVVTETDSTGTGAGNVGWSYGAIDSTFDFLGAGQTLTITETVTINDGHGGVASKSVTITVTGANDAPVAASTASTGAIAEIANVTGSATIDGAAGSFGFTDADLSDLHSVSAAAPSFAWSGGTLTTAQISALTTASSFALTKVDSTGAGAGSVGWKLSAADNAFDFLAAGQQLTIAEAIRVDDNHGGIVTKPVTVTVMGANDAPVFTGTISNQQALDYYAVMPFTAASVLDADAGALDSLTITLLNGKGQATDANGTISDATKTGTGTYALAAQTPAALTTALDALTFTPTRGEVAAGQTVLTTFALKATDGIATINDSTTNVVVTALNYINGPSFGLGLLFGTSGIDVITAKGSANAIFGSGGNDIIDAGNGLATVKLGNGNVTVTLGGNLNTVSGGNGNVTVTGAPGGLTVVTLGTGNDVVQIGGTNNVVNLGDGVNKVVLTGGQARVTTGAGNDTITLAGRGNTVDAGAGVNVISGGAGSDTFILPAAGKGFDLISGFDEANGDILDLRPALWATSWNHTASTLGNYLKVTDSGGMTNLAIAPAGSGASTSIASLTNTTYGLADLLSHHSLLVS